MKIEFGAGLLFSSAVLLAGCSGFWNLPAGTSTTTTTPTTLSSGIFYVLDQTTKQIVGYSINSGTLAAISNGTATLADAPSCIAIAPGSTQSGGFLYVGTINGIYLYTIGSGGSLVLANNNNPISSDIPASMLVSGSWLVDAFDNASGSVQMDAIPINPTTGLYTGSGGTPASQAFSITDAAVKQMVLSSDGANLFVALGAGGTIVVPFSTGNTSNPLGGTAKTIPPAATGGSALSVAVDPTTRVFYIGETEAVSGSGGLRVFNYSSLTSGTLTQATGSPIASGGSGPNAILPEASGSYVYVANGTGNTSAGNVAWFPISASGTTYTIAAGSNISSGIFPIGLAEDSQNHFVLAVSSGGSTTSGNPDLEGYTMSSGTLTSAVASQTGTDPVGAIAIAPLP